MEQRRLQITRRTDQTARALIAGVLKKSVVELRGDYPDEILQVVNNFSFDFTHIPELGLEYAGLFQDKHINNLLELMYLDLIIQYGDVFEFQDYLVAIKDTFSTAISANVVRASEILSRARDYKELSLRRFTYTDIIHESFNSSRNMSLFDFPLDVNNGAGLLKLPGMIDNYARAETSNIYLNVQSSNAVLLDESDSNQSYSSDMTDPYFVTVTSIGNPDNDITEDWDFAGEGYDGCIVDLVTRFNTIQPVTRVSFTPFSISKIDIPCVFYSTAMNAEWDSGEMILVKDIDITYDTDTVEINFGRVFAREIHVILHQRTYNLARTNTETEDTLSANDYITEVKSNLKHIVPMGFVEPIYVGPQIDEIISYVEEQAQVKTGNLSPNTRVYVIGICGLEVQNVAYANYGEYLDVVRPMNGVLHSVSFTQTDNYSDIVDVLGSGTVDMCSILSITAGENSIYLGTTNDNGDVIDGSVVEANLEYNSGALTRSTTIPYKFKTHFLPTSEFDNFTMYTDGRAFSIPNDADTEIDTYTATIKLPADFSEAYNLQEGSVVTMTYTPPEEDCFGQRYRVYEANIGDIIGRPNLAVNEVFSIVDQYIHVIASGENISYAEDEYVKVLLSGEVYYQLEINKGFDVDGETIFENEGYYYVSPSVLSGPFHNFYYGSLKEEPLFVESGELYGFFYAVYSVEESYVKGTLSLFSYDKLVTSGLLEYDNDTYGSIGSDEDKKLFVISDPDYDSGGLTVCYIPVYSEATTDYIAANIAQYNATEKFLKTVDTKLVLSKYPHLDHSILTSDMFDFSNGMFYLKSKYSVVYEPITVYVNGIKAVNITEYQTDINTIPTFRKSYRDDDYQYYVENGNTLVFNKDVAGSIMVYYYKSVDSIQTGVEMYRSNYSRDDLSPEIYNYTILANIQR